MKFCSNCASPVTLTVPPADNRPRYVCPACNAIHYQNPRIVTGTVCTWGERILLCRRAIEPRYQRRLLPLLVRHLATPEGEAFVRSLGRGEAAEG